MVGILRRSELGAIVVALLMTRGAMATEQTVEFQQGTNSYTGTQDTAIFQDFPSNSSGGYPYLFAGMNKTSHPRRTLIKFQISGEIPADSVITSAALKLHADFGRPGSFPGTLYPLTGSWAQGVNPLTSDSRGQGAAAQTGDPTWNARAFDTATWNTAGGDFDTVSSATGIVGKNDSDAWFTGGGMIQDIQDWADGTKPNNGWILLVDEATPWNAKRFSSSEADTITDRPKLTVTFDRTSTVSDWELY